MTPSAVHLVVGADGTIGGALLHTLRAGGVATVGTALQPQGATAECLRLDLTETPDRWPLPDQVATAFLGAAITSLEACRTAPEASRLINVERTVALACLLRERGARIVFPSTNLVFDGRIPFRKGEEHLNPQTEYGRQKATAEAELLALGDRVAVVRLTKVVSPKMRPLAEWMTALRAGRPIHPFLEMVMSPVSVGFVVRVLAEVAERHLAGILQVSATRDVTYADVAGHLARRIGAALDLVQPISTTQADITLESIPLYSTLDTSRLRQELGLAPPDAWEAIDGTVKL